MPIFRIESPDGRTIKVEGDHTPTAEDINAIFTSLSSVEQPQVEQEESRGTTSGIVHSALKGAAAGLSPKLIAGSEAVSKVGPYDFMQNKSIAEAIATKKSYEDKIDQVYELALDKEIAKQDAFEKEHPVASFVADVAGGFALPVGVAAKAAKTTKEAIKAGSKIGGVMGALRGANETRGDIADRAINTAIGGAIGGITGGVLAPVTRAAGSAISKSAQNLANAIERARLKKIVDAKPETLSASQKKVLKNVLGSEERVNAVIEQAKGKGVTLAELGNDNINRVLQAAEMVSPDARITISDYKERFESELPQMAQAKLDSVLKTESGMKSIPEMQAYYNAKAKPLYDQANATKIPVDLLRPDNTDSLYGNSLIADAADEATKNYAKTFGGRGQVKVDDLQFWDGVKRVLDDKIDVATRAGEKNAARNLMAAKNELVSKLDELSPVYKQARSVASNTPSVEKAEGVAEKIFNSNITPENLSRQMGEMTPAELDAVKIGVRNKIINLMDTKIDPSTGFGKLLPKQSQENLKVLLGKDAADELIGFAKRVHSIKNALYAAKGGSQTGARITMADELNQSAKDAMSLKSVGSGVNLVVRKATDSATRAANNKTFNDLANLILYGKYPTPKRVTSGSKYVPKILESLGKGLEKSGKYIYRLPAKSSGTINERLKQALKAQ